MAAVRMTLMMQATTMSVRYVGHLVMSSLGMGVGPDSDGVAAGVHCVVLLLLPLLLSLLLFEGATVSGNATNYVRTVDY